MSKARAKEVEELFQRVADLPVEEHGRFLDQYCGSDVSLRSELESLLRHEGEASQSFLQRRPEEIARHLAAEQPGKTVGPYTLLSHIGEGAFGNVYLAEQSRPVRRNVALKMIKLGMDTKQVIARFEAERQALAMLDHPNVAKVFDAGETESGRSYFVMEYVPGIPITEYCDRHRLSIEKRLRLFVQVCDAIQHAHHKGIIHRDVKPTNVLVTERDGHPTPKVIDLGMAKAMGGRLTEKTLLTEQGQLMGTPEYMSPEQADLSRLDVDSRTDIYSLGVVLYELLTGARPFDRELLRQAPLGEIPRIIREHEPLRPSMRLRRLGDSTALLGRKRDTSAKSLRRDLRGDLDWITMKALEKDRTRRYETANALGMDIQRHLKREPVLACPPTPAYRVRKFVRRNRALVMGAGAIALVLMAGVAISTYFAIGQAQARAEAEDQRAETERLESVAQMVTEFLINDVIGSLDPYVVEGVSELVAPVLQAVTQRMGQKFEAEPLLEASIRRSVGLIYTHLGQYPLAETHLLWALEIHEHELGKEHPHTLRSMCDLAYLYWWQGRYDEGVTLAKQAAGIGRRILGEEDAIVLETQYQLANNLFSQGRYDEAAALYEQIHATRLRVLGMEGEETLWSMMALAGAYSALGRLEEAHELFTEAVRESRRVFGDEHLQTAYLMTNMGINCVRQGLYQEAEELYRHALSVRRRQLGEVHPETSQVPVLLADLYKVQGRFVEAETMLLNLQEAVEDAVGPAYNRKLNPVEKLVDLYDAWGKADKAAEWRAKLTTEQEAVASDKPGQRSSDETQDE